MKFIKSQIVNKLTNLKTRILIILLGFISLVWFLVRVVPKPSRAFYPCQRVAFPLASAFIIWLFGTFSSLFSLKKAREKFNSSRFFPAAIFIFISVVSFVISWLLVPSQDNYARLISEKINIESVPIAIQQSQIENGLAKPVAKVSVVKSDIANASDLTTEEIEELVREAVNQDAVLDTLIKDGQTVVIKPNLVSNMEYSAGSARRLPALMNGVITDWRVIRAVVNIVRDYNPTGKIYVLEGSADGGTTRTIMSQYGYNNDNMPGVDEFIYLEEASGEWEEWDSELLSKVVLPPGKALYPNNIKPNASDTFYLNKIYYESDVLISVPLLKNHSMTSVTGAVKNVGIGATPQRIYAGKSDNHRYTNNRIDHNNYTNLHKFIHDFYLCRPVDYVIMEALEGTDYGPVAEHPTSLESSQKNMRMILTGKDAVAVDAIASLLMEYDPLKVNHLVYLHNDTSGCADPASIRVFGPDLNILKQNFRHYSSTGPKYSDFTPPDVKITDYMVSKNNLRFSFSPIEEIIKVEIKVNGQYLDESVLEGFEDINIDMEQEIPDDATLKVKVYDKYLNCKTFTIEGRVLVSVDQDEDVMADLKIYPNPANNYLNVSFENNFSGNINLDFYDLAGKNIFSGKYYKDPGRFDVEIDLKIFSAGKYFLKLCGNDFTLSTSMVVLK